MKTPDTETIDRLFLELSQFSKATTAKELNLKAELEQAQAVIRDRDEKINRHGAIQLEKDAELEQAQARITQLEDRLKPQPTLSWPANCRGI